MENLVFATTIIFTLKGRIGKRSSHEEIFLSAAQHSAG